MEAKKTQKTGGTKENGESKIAKSKTEQFKTGTKSKTLAEKKKAPSMKTTAKATVTCGKLKQTQIANQNKNVKRISIAKVSKDVMNHFEVKNDDQKVEGATGITAFEKETTTKRAPLKEKRSQASTKQSGNLRKQQSEPDLKPYAAFGGMRFVAKRNPSRKVDLFQKIMKETKDRQVANVPEPYTEDLKTTVSTKTIASREIEQPNEGNFEKPPIVKADSSKPASLTVNEITLKHSPASGGVQFKPKWHSTPLKPDVFDNIPKVIKQDKEPNAPGSSAKCPKKTPNSIKAITEEKYETITSDETIFLDETLQPSAKEARNFKKASPSMKEIGSQMYPAFAGMRMIPKRKSTHPQPDIFEKKKEESKIDDQESHASGSSTKELKTIPGSTVAKVKETQHADVEKMEQPTTQKTELSKKDDASKNERRVVPKTFGGIRFKPTQKNLHDIF